MATTNTEMTPEIRQAFMRALLDTMGHQYDPARPLDDQLYNPPVRQAYALTVILERRFHITEIKPRARKRKPAASIARTSSRKARAEPAGVADITGNAPPRLTAGGAS